MVQNGGHVDLVNSAPRSLLSLDVRAPRQVNMPMYKTQRMKYIYIYTETRISHILELKVKINRSYKIFKIFRKQERKFILSNVLQTAFKFILEHSK
jgi:hypothetical protein